jgi:hypothetical protein
MKKNTLLFPIFIIAILIASCKKEKTPVFEDYSETRSATHAYIELCAIVDCASRVMDGVSKDTFAYKTNDGDPLTIDTLNSNRGPMNSDNRTRVGFYEITYLGHPSDSNCIFTIKFNYTLDKINIVGNLQLQRNKLLGSTHKIATGTYKLNYMNQSSCDATVNMINWYSGVAQYYTGNLDGNLSDGKTFEGKVTGHPLISRKCFESTSSESAWENGGIRSIMAGEVEFTTSTQGKGRIWFGQDAMDCDRYAVADWLEKGLQFHINMDDY